MKPTQYPDPASLFEIVPLAAREGPVCLAVAVPAAAFAAEPGFPQAALPQSGRLASGRGLTPELCRASALGEAAELVSCCAWGNEELVSASGRELGPAALALEDLKGFSAAQIDSRLDWNARYKDFDWRPARCDPNRPIDWLQVEHALDGEDAFVPADFVFIGRKQAGDEQAVMIGDSNGCACGGNAEDAKATALLELIERDAAARWWYGRRRRPAIDLASIEDRSGIVTWLRGRRRLSYLFDITSDLGVPVVAAVSAEPDGSDVTLGFAARLDASEAALSALTEMVQIEFSLAAARALGSEAGNWAIWRAGVTMKTPPLDAALPGQTTILRERRNSGGPLAHLLAVCDRAEIPIWFAGMTRESVGVPAYRAISPVLCPLKPRLGKARLLAAGANDLEPALPSPETQAPLLI